MFSLPFTVERSIVIKKPLEEIMQFVADFSNWTCWSPWLIQEPDCSIQRQGMPHTIGHSQAWDGKQIGKGDITLKKIKENSCLEYDLVFYAPWKSSSKTQFVFSEEKLDNGETGCKVTWLMQSSLPIFMFFMKKMMSAWVGSDYERGLAMLKEQMETGSVCSKVVVDGVQSRPAFYFSGYRVSGTLDTISDDVEPVFDKLCNAGFPAPDLLITQVEKFDFVSKQTQFVLAMAYFNKPDFEFPADIVQGFVPEHKALGVTHTGRYMHLPNGWATLMGYLRSYKFKANKKIPEYEVYLNSPQEIPEAELKTAIFAPVK